eukprot:scaffold8928_cov294-Ochromonas_danica.AAC.1
MGGAHVHKRHGDGARFSRRVSAVSSPAVAGAVVLSPVVERVVESTVVPAGIHRWVWVGVACGVPLLGGGWALSR